MDELEIWVRLYAQLLINENYDNCIDPAKMADDALEEVKKRFIFPGGLRKRDEPKTDIDEPR